MWTSIKRFHLVTVFCVLSIKKQRLFDSEGWRRFFRFCFGFVGSCIRLGV